MKKLSLLLLPSLAVIMAACPFKDSDNVKPQEKKLIEILRISIDSSGVFFLTQADKNTFNSASIIHFISYNSPTIKYSEGNMFYIPFVTEEVCQNFGMDCMNRNNIEIDITKIKIETLGINDGKYLISSGGGFFLTYGSKISIKTKDGNPIFVATTETKEYKVKQIDFIAGEREVNQTDIFAGHLRCDDGFYCGNDDRSATFYSTWSSNNVQKSTVGSRSRSVKSVDELQNMLHESVKKSFSVVKKGCHPAVDFKIEYLFGEKVISYK